MPVVFDIMDNEVFAPVILRSIQQGTRDVIRALLEKRFGSIPVWVEDRLTAASTAQLNEFALRLLDAQTFQQIFNATSPSGSAVPPEPAR